MCECVCVCARAHSAVSDSLIVVHINLYVCVCARAHSAVSDSLIVAHDINLYVCVCVCVYVRVRTQLCLTLCNPRDCSLPGSSLHGIFQARILEQVAISYW